MIAINYLSIEIGQVMIHFVVGSAQQYKFEIKKRERCFKKLAHLNLRLVQQIHSFNAYRNKFFNNKEVLNTEK